MPTPTTTFRRQRGIALITALLVVAIAAVVAVEIAARERLDIRRTQNLLARDQAYDLAVAAESWTLDLLRADLDDPDNRGVDGPQDVWAQDIVLPPFEGATLAMRIEDLQGRFNLNNLARLTDPQQAQTDRDYQRFKLLLENLRDQHQLELNPAELADALLDWLDADQQVRQLGAEDSYYMSLDHPRRAADQLLVSPTELLLVKGFTPEIYRALAPNVTALPITDAEINVNTAPPDVLRMLDRRIGEAAAEQLDRRRRDEAWKTIDEFAQSTEVPRTGFAKDGLTVGSSYFAFHGDVSLGPARVRLHSLIGRASGMQVLQRARGTL